MKKTEQLIIKTFLELVEETTLDKITIQEIADQCGINRNTFYYHFADIYSLIETIFKDHLATIEQMFEDGASWSECSEKALKFLVENRRAIRHIAFSMSRNQLDHYLFVVFKKIFTEYLLDNFIVDISDEKFDDLILFYTYAIMGCINHNFIENNNDIELEELLDKFNTTLLMTNPLKARSSLNGRLLFSCLYD